LHLYHQAKTSNGPGAFPILDTLRCRYSSITVAELEYGICKSQRQERNRAALMQFLLPLEIVEFDQSAAIIYGSIRSDLESRGLVIGSMDMLIAAHALSLNLILVTNNIQEFSRVPMLALENWVKS